MSTEYTGKLCHICYKQNLWYLQLQNTIQISRWKNPNFDFIEKYKSKSYQMILISMLTWYNGKLKECETNNSWECSVTVYEMNKFNKIYKQTLDSNISFLNTSSKFICMFIPQKMEFAFTTETLLTFFFDFLLTM